jgi:hypothetical protein
MSHSLRLTIVHSTVWTAVLLFLLFGFRALLNDREVAFTSSLLWNDWAAMKGYLKIENGRLLWYFDNEDRDESVIVTRLRQNLVITDARGRVMEAGIGSPEKAVLTAARRIPANVPTASTGRNGVRMVLLRGELWDESRSHTYSAFMGRPIVSDRMPIMRLLTNPIVMILLAVGISLSISGLLVRYGDWKRNELPPAEIVS